MTRKQNIGKLLTALKEVVVETCVACYNSPLPTCRREENMETCLNDTFISIIVDAFQDHHPKCNVLTGISWDPASEIAKYFIQPYKDTRNGERDRRFIYCELYTKDNRVVGHRVQIEDVDHYLHLERDDIYLQNITEHLRRMCELEHRCPDRETRSELPKLYEALEKDVQGFFHIWYYQNSITLCSGDAFCDIINAALDEKTRQHYKLKWDHLTDRVRVVFKRQDGKRSSFSIDINFKWFAEVNITGMVYRT